LTLYEITGSLLTSCLTDYDFPMKFKSLILIFSITCLLLSACASDGKRKFNRTTQLSPGVRALVAQEEDIGLNDPRIRCRRENKSGSRIGVQSCYTVEEIEAERAAAQRQTDNASQRN